MKKEWFGWTGKILRVNLSTNKINVEDLPEDLARKFIGCRGINVKILYDEVGPEVSPFSPENKLIIGTGPLEGTPVGMGKVSVATKSSNGTVGEGGCGGFWGPEIKYAGYDHIIIEGKSEELVYLWIDGEKVELKNAVQLKGKTVSETDELIKKELGDSNIQIACIGPAGENQVRSSTIMGNLTHSGGRNGFGEIMGNKKLKGIAVRGYKGVKVFDPDKFIKTYNKILSYIDMKNADDHYTQMYHLFGPSGGIKLFNFVGGAPTFNHQDLTWDEIGEKLSGERYLEKYTKKSRAAAFCYPFVSCGDWYEVDDGEYAGTKGENIWSATFLNMGYLVGCDSIEAALKVRSLCNDYGIDFMGVTYRIAWAMECRQKGILTIKDMDNIDLKWGNHQAMVAMTKKIVFREGFGDILAQGVEKASEIVGKGSDEFALTVKGKELDILEHRNNYAIALGNATSESGPDHTKWWPPYNPPISPSRLQKEYKEQGIDIDPNKVAQLKNPDEKAKFMKWKYDTGAVIESLPTCIFMVKEKLAIDYSIWNDILNEATGFDYGLDEMIQCGERIVNVERAFIAREGYRRMNDTIPKRMMEESASVHEPLKEADLDKMLDEYYEARGWDKETAIPTEKKLKEIGLEDVYKNLKQHGVI